MSRLLSSLLPILLLSLQISANSLFVDQNQQISFESTPTPLITTAADKVVRYSFSSHEDLKQALARIENLDVELDIWRAAHLTLDIRVSSGVEDVIATILDASSVIGNKDQVVVSTLLPSISDLIRSNPTISTKYNSELSQYAIANFTKATPLQLDDPIHSSYHPYDGIVLIMQKFVEDYPEYAEMVNLGQSSEGRDIWGLRVTNSSSAHHKNSYRGEAEEVIRVPIEAELDGESEELDLGSNHKKGHKKKKGRKGSKKPLHGKLGYVVNAGQHAREWISPSTTLYLAHKLLLATVDQPDKDSDAPLLTHFTFLFVPVTNVDGYVYSWEHDRLWRKNRQDVGDGCFGVDLNRNWGFKWDAGHRPNPCSDAFPGKEPFQAPELRALRDYVLDPENHVVSFLDLHSFGQMMMFPFSYSCQKSSPDEENHFEAVVGASKALRSVHGRNFEVGSVCSVSLSSAGHSIDWTYAVAHVRWSFTFELRDYGIWGFLLPPSQIIPSGEEVSAALSYIGDFVHKKESGIKRFE